MAKDIDSLIASRNERARIEKLLGCIPESILKHCKSVKAIDLAAEGRSYEKSAHNYGQNGNLDHIFKQSGQGSRNGALSRFPQNIGRTLLSLYTEPGQTVVDPFAGHNSRMEFCWRAGRNYIGCDLSKDFMSKNRQIKEMLLHERETDLFPAEHHSTITLHECDSRKMPVKSNTGDFTITSPPYWNIEDYGDEIGQLGKNDYPEFLRQITRVASENFRCLKSMSYCVWCVNDFRSSGKFYSYHTDTINFMRSVGFRLHDTAIIDLGSSFLSSFASQIVEFKILPKRHEYALVFWKP